MSDTTIHESASNRDTIDPNWPQKFNPFTDSLHFGSSPTYYCWLFAILSAILFWATILIPYFYDQKNLEQFIVARESSGLFIREYLPYQLMNERSDIFSFYQKKEQAQNEQFATISFEVLKDKKIISSDYITQMQNAEALKKLKAYSFGWTVAMGILLIIFNSVILRFVKNHGWRVPAITLFFFLFLVLFWQLGDLPHINKKFHVIMGAIYSLILAISDFLFTLDLKLGSTGENSENTNANGYLSSLQYKHRYYCIVFNTIIIFFVTMLGTFGFKTMDFFYKIFGEGFVIYPLVGLLTAIGIAIFVIILCILFPLRKHIASIENSMTTTII